jgi:hypothetical protein
MPRQNYRQAKRAREETRKKRQDEKRQKKLTRPEDPAPPVETSDAKELP